jgi:hypothetical protein
MISVDADVEHRLGAKTQNFLLSRARDKMQTRLDFGSHHLARGISMRKQACVTLAALVAASIPLQATSAATLTASKEQVRSACNKAGGELLGVSEHGSYGCDNGKNGGGMILCNKNSECTAYTASRKSSDIRKMKTFLAGAAAVKE